MRLRILLLISAGFNVIFAAACLFGLVYFSRPGAAPYVRDIDAVNPSSNPNATSVRMTNVIVRPQNFTWEQVESEDYATYIENLRKIGCPDSTIRDIIVADVNQHYAHRRAAEVVSADHQWWRSEPDMDLIQAAANQIRTLEKEKRALLTRLLGPGWEIASGPVVPATRTGISLTGPVLGELPNATKQTIYDVAARTQEKIEAYQREQAQGGLAVDPAELARLRQESRNELGKVLTPVQMEEFLLRYSSTAYQMRDELRGLDFSPEEFRNMFRARDATDSQSELYYAGDDPVKLRRKRELEAQRETALQQAVGPERYVTYKLFQDPLFQRSQATAQQVGASAAMVLPIYQINQVTEAERQRIREDTTLTNEEKIDALAAAQAEQQKSLEKILGPEALQQFLQGANNLQ